LKKALKTTTVALEDGILPKILVVPEREIWSACWH
jgi:hypothetical protein